MTTIKNKLYNFLNKRRVLFVMVPLPSSYFGLIATGFTDKPLAALLVLVMLTSLTIAFFLACEETTRSQARALQSLKDQQNNASSQRFYVKLSVDRNFADALTKLANRLHRTEAEVVIDALNYYSNDVYAWDKTHGIGEETT